VFTHVNGSVESDRDVTRYCVIAPGFAASRGLSAA